MKNFLESTSKRKENIMGSIKYAGRIAYQYDKAHGKKNPGYREFRGPLEMHYDRMAGDQGPHCLIRHPDDVKKPSSVSGGSCETVKTKGKKIMPKKERKNIWELDMFESTGLETPSDPLDGGRDSRWMTVTRVPGGWIFSNLFAGANFGTFVPWSEEGLIVGEKVDG
jgi:hypothetical protein